MVMFGRFYFHMGDDQWFANFWKGKAYGEGRSYSKSGDVFFCHFEDGRRHGHFLYITAYGARYIEIWNEGVLMSPQQMDTDAVLG
ncbi:protein ACCUMULATION AND REPLICATION OF CHLOROPLASTS 3-like [Durio zibethinus]|uniref:Protein ACCUMULATION AND REPLICATION OF CHLOROPLASTS 3-like n=1 Tax=Durio zibethinus TaxID=66656 RepID=A0A6P6BHH9_DURZI|nr:protein ACCUMULATION AND REPLICATION OF CHLOROPLASTS 3-like [Durio zibethinus]